MNNAFPPWVPPRVAIAGSDQVFPARRIWCVGQNYASHVLEMGNDPTRDPPFFFAKPPDALTSGGFVPYPPATADLHHEVELVVALGPGAEIFGYAVGLDLTRRDLQAAAKAKGRPWTLGKGFDFAAPISPIARVSDVGHPRAGRIWLAVDGVVRQDGDLAQMTWSVEELLAQLARYVTLQAGDLVFTGTPAGVGPLLPGARLAGGVTGIGEIAVQIGPTGSVPAPSR